MLALDTLGWEWLSDQVDAMDHEIVRQGPVTYNEENRYLPQGVSPRPGYIRYDLFPYLREILECFDPTSDVREVNFKKGVQVGYTTLLESVLFYYIGYIKTQGCMYITADKELATLRVDNNIIPMINDSGLEDLVRSSDVNSSRKTGKTKDYLQWQGGGYCVFNGAVNATKMRQTSVPLMLKDELDGWKRAVGKDGNSDGLTDDRLSAYWEVRKILRGSTPLLVPSMIDEAYQRGDQRKYHVLCRSCSKPQEIRMERVNKETGVISGFKWETQDGGLILESVRYACECGREHFEADKEALFSTEHGAHWVPTATPREPGIRSYHLPAWYSPFNFRPWSKNISDYIEGYDSKNKQVLDIGKYQKFYNNVLGEAFQVQGTRVRMRSVELHRRPCYKYGEIPNSFAAEYSGSEVVMLTCQVDVHKRNLAVSVMGWTVTQTCFLIDYWRFERENDDDDCSRIESPVWDRLRKLIEDKRYIAANGIEYQIAITFVDAGYANDTVNTFCSDYESGVFPILGRERPAKNQVIKEFGEFRTQLGTRGFRILVDHYKDRMSPALRREWTEEFGAQIRYHFNAPVDATSKQLKEMTVERRVEDTDDRGNVAYRWHRPGNVDNELWDLLGYGHAAVEVYAYLICLDHFGLDNVDWGQFWPFAQSEENDSLFGRRRLAQDDQ